MKRLGPELKMPEMKAPAFLADLFWDLRERRLLPLLALVVVAIAAVPFLLGKKTHGEASAVEASVGAMETQAPGGSSKFVVVQAKPGLRAYKKRLKVHARPQNPFKPHFTAPVQTVKFGTGGEGGSSSNSSVPSPTFTGGPESSPGGSAPGGSSTPAPQASPPSPSQSGAPAKPHIIFFSFAINAKITKYAGKASGKKSKPEATVKNRVLPDTPLPGEKQPVVTYLGVSKKHKALLLVSDSVASVFGEGHCVSGERVCQLLEVEPGFPEEFLFGPNEVKYTINVLKIELVVVGRH